MIVFVVARTVPIISSNNGRQRSHIVGHVCLIFATIASSLLLAARLAMQLFQSAANCSFPLLFLQSAFLLTTWPTNRLQIERKPATSYAPALLCSALPGSPKSLLPSAITPCPLPVQLGQPTCNLRQRRRHCSMSMAQPVSASFVVRGQPPFCRCASVLRFTLYILLSPLYRSRGRTS